MFTLRIYASGFNAHGQIDPQIKPCDITTFSRIQSKYLEDAPLEIFHSTIATWSDFLIEVDGKILLRGFRGSNDQPAVVPDSFDSIKCVADNGSEFLSLIDSNGVILTLCQSKLSDQTCEWGFVQHQFSESSFVVRKHLVPTGIAIANNDQVCLLAHCQGSVTARKGEGLTSNQTETGQELYIFPSHGSFLSGEWPLIVHWIPSHIECILAMSTAFIALAQDGKVYTFGDARHPASLGRTPTAEHPATAPHPIDALEEHKVQKIACGKWIGAAVTTEQDLYIWGAGKPGTTACFEKAGDGDGIVRPVDIDDVVQIGVGDEHIVVRTGLDTIWGFGSNEYGQLGLGVEVKDTAGKWTKLADVFGQPDTLDVQAGPLTTLVTAIDIRET
ncbi:MAG: hypothetical protein Q9190_002989 [Brigantiaea leucoxantha]